jgi:hypothetical protein
MLQLTAQTDSATQLETNLMGFCHCLYKKIPIANSKANMRFLTLMFNFSVEAHRLVIVNK